MIIDSILDTDIYKLSMQQAVCQLYPHAKARYEFIDRKGADWPKGFDAALWQEITEMCNIKLSHNERKYLEKYCPYLTPVYLDLLQSHRFNPGEVRVSMDDGRHSRRLSVSVEGAWYKTILWEVPLLALISELYYKKKRIKPTMNKGELLKYNQHKAGRIPSTFAEFGTRRRFSKRHQSQVLQTLYGYSLIHCIGTSNVKLAMESNRKPIGTMAHEWIMFHAAKYGYANANAAALDNWMRVYNGDLGIALTDTYGSDNFFESFSLSNSKLFDGVRQDSGGPIAFVEKAIRHYETMGIDPKTKTIIFSDNLDSIRKLHDIRDACKDRIKYAYGIGTWLSNDVGADKLNMVIKMTACKTQYSDWIPTVKLSDDEGKHTGDAKEISLCKRTLAI